MKNQRFATIARELFLTDTDLKNPNDHRAMAILWILIIFYFDGKMLQSVKPFDVISRLCILTIDNFIVAASSIGGKKQMLLKSSMIVVN